MGCRVYSLCMFWWRGVKTDGGWGWGWRVRRGSFRASLASIAQHLSSLNLLWLFNLHLSHLLKKVSSRSTIFTEILQRCPNPGAKTFVSYTALRKCPNVDSRMDELTGFWHLYFPFSLLNFGILQRNFSCFIPILTVYPYNIQCNLETVAQNDRLAT